MKIGGDTTTNATPTPTPAPKPQAPAAPRATVATDQLKLKTAGTGPVADPLATYGDEPKPDAAKAGQNVLDNSVGRKTYDVVAGTAGAADGARGIRSAADGVRTLSEGTKLGSAGGKLGGLLEWFANAGAAIGAKAPMLASALGGLAKAAPLLGVGVAFLDVGKAVIEEDPRKKQKAWGMAFMSGVSGLAGVLAYGGMIGAAAFGVALAPIAVPAMIVGGVVTAIALADTFLLKGKISSAIGGAFDAIGDVAGKVWNAL